MDKDRLEADSCQRADVDLCLASDPHKMLHIEAEVFAEFVNRAKAGEFDHLCPPYLLHREGNDGQH